MADAFPLVSLPPEVLRIVLECLSGDNVSKLWYTGSNTMQLLLGPRGAWKSLSLEHVLHWPRFIRHLRLEKLSLRCSYSIGSPAIYISGVDMTSLPSTLTNLEFNFPNALSALLLLPHGVSLATLVPSLTKFSLGMQYIPTFSKDAFLGSLPGGLRSLHLPPNISFSAQSIQQGTSTTLTDLDIAMHVYSPGDEDYFRQMTSLTSLKLLVPKNTPWTRFAHRALLELSVAIYLEPAATINSVMYNAGYGSANFVSDANLAWWPSVEDFQNDLPPCLTSLTVPTILYKTYSLDHLRVCPKSCTKLHLLPVESDVDLAQLLSLLPPAIRDIDCGDLFEIAPGLVDRLPPTLTHWGGLMFNSTPVPAPLRLPPALVDLSIADLYDYQPLYIPPTLERLQLANVSKLTRKRATELAAMTSLTSLHAVCLHSVVDYQNLLQYLPPHLLKLYYRGQLPPTKWTPTWPTSLGELRLSLSNALLIESLWTTLPKTLHTLIITALQCDSFPDSMACLPRTLTSFSLAVSFDSPGATTSVTVQDSNLLGAPLKLRTLRLYGLHFNITPEILTLLPRSLTCLSFVPFTRRVSQTITFPVDLFATRELYGQNLAQVNAYLERLPPHLVFGNKFGLGPAPLISEFQARRLALNLQRACPNVLFVDMPSQNELM